MDFDTLNLLFRCNRSFSHKRVHRKGLSETECMICTYVYSHPGCSQDEASAALKTDKTTIAKALLVLDERHCIQRVRDIKDRRRNHLFITEEGNEIISDLMGIHNEWLNTIKTCLNEKEQKQFENYCERLLDAAEKLAQEQ